MLMNHRRYIVKSDDGSYDELNTKKKKGVSWLVIRTYFHKQEKERETVFVRVQMKKGPC